MFLSELRCGVLFRRSGGMIWLISFGLVWVFPVLVLEMVVLQGLSLPLGDLSALLAFELSKVWLFRPAGNVRGALASFPLCWSREMGALNIYKLGLLAKAAAGDAASGKSAVQRRQCGGGSAAASPAVAAVRLWRRN